MESKKYGLKTRLAAVAATGLLVMGLGAGAAMAADASSQPGNTFVTISGLNTSGTSGDTVTAYQIADIKVQDDNTLKYTFDTDLPNNSASGGSDYQDLSTWTNISSDGTVLSSTDGINTNAQKAAAIAAGVKAQLTTPTAAGITATATDTNKTGSATLTLAPGYYLVQVTSTSGNTKVYQNMLVNLTPKAGTNGDYSAADAVTLAAKSTDAPTPEKTISASANGTFDESTNALSVGDTAYFKITTAIPSYPSNATNAAFTVGDTPTNFTISADSVKVTVNNANVSAKSGDTTNYTVSVDSSTGKLTVVFDKNYVLANQGESVVITYNGKITSINNKNGENDEGNNITVNDGKATNSATVTFAPNPYEESTSETNPDTTEADTYGFEFRKVYQDDSGSINGTGDDSSTKYTALAGAQFTVYSDQEHKTVVTAAGTNGVITSGSDGYVYADGLAAGTYYLVETKVPAGYQKVSDFSITLDSSDTSDAAHTSAVTESNYDVSTGLKADAKAGTLPQTGGAGTIAITAGGVVLVAGGAYIVLRSRRRNQNEE